MEDVFAAVDARPKRRQGVTGQTIEAQMRGTMCQISEYELDMLRDEIARLKDESAFLKDLMGQRTITIRKLEAERDEALAASAAREIAMRDLAAEHAWNKRDLLADAEKKQIDAGLSGRDYYGRRLEAELLSRSIRALPLSPDGQQALNEMLARAWDEGHTVGVVWPEKERNPYRKDAT